MGMIVTEEDLIAAWPFVIKDAANNFIFDVIDYEDYRLNLNILSRQLSRAIGEGYYTPEPLWAVDIPKKSYSVRPGAVISPADMLICYAILAKVAAALDQKLKRGVCSYRIGGRPTAGAAPLFPGAEAEPDVEEVVSPYEVSEGGEVAASFPGWFAGWHDFYRLSKAAASCFPYVGRADIAAFFEHISITTLRDRLREVLSGDDRDAANMLCDILEFWGITPFGGGPSRAVLPQGNDISLFLSNFALLDLDNALASESSWRYLRYVDDIRIFTNSEQESRRALLLCEKELRRLAFNLQSEKTVVSRSSELFDAEVERVCEELGGLDGHRVACSFWEEGRWRDDLPRWERAYLRALAVLTREGDDTAFDDVLGVFLSNPSYKLLVRNFHYLSRFAARKRFGSFLIARLTDPGFILPYHRYYILRLAAYCREDVPELREVGWAEVRNRRRDWFCRYAALFLLHTYHLTAEELEEIYDLVDAEPHPALVRAGLVTLRQRPQDARWSMRDALLAGCKKGQQILYTYFHRLSLEEGVAKKLLAEVAAVDCSSPGFIRYLHVCDLLRGNASVRAAVHEVIKNKLAQCDYNWGRTRTRLEGILERMRYGFGARRGGPMVGAERYLNTFLRDTRDAVALVGLNGRVAVWNEGAALLFGYTAEEAAAEGFARRLLPDDADRDFNAFVRRVENAGVMCVENLVRRHKDGRLLTLRGSYSVLKDEGGEIMGLSVILTDITDAVRAKFRDRFLKTSERVLSAASATLASPENLRRAIVKVLKAVGLALRAKRVWITEFNNSGGHTINYEWHMPGVSPLPAVLEGVAPSCVHSWAEALRRGEMVVMADLGQVAPPERKVFRKYNVFAFVAAPLFVSGELRGFLAADDNRYRDWLPEEISTLRSVATTLAKAIEREEAVAQLRASEERFRQLVEGAGDLIFRYRYLPEERFDYVSPSVARVLGYMPDDFYSDPGIVDKVVHNDDRVLVFGLGKEPVAQPKKVVTRWFNREGRLIWLEQVNVPAYDTTGRVVAVDVIARDITDRLAAEAALTRERRWAELLLESASDVIIVLDLNGNVLYANRRAYGLLGWGNDQRQGKPACREFSLPGFSEKGLNALRRLLGGEAGDVLKIEHPILARDGKVVPMVWRLTVVRNELQEKSAILCAGMTVGREGGVPSQKALYEKGPSGDETPPADRLFGADEGASPDETG